MWGPAGAGFPGNTGREVTAQGLIRVMWEPWGHFEREGPVSDSFNTLSVLSGNIEGVVKQGWEKRLPPSRRGRRARGMEVDIRGLGLQGQRAGSLS